MAESWEKKNHCGLLKLHLITFDPGCSLAAKGTEGHLCKKYGVSGGLTCPFILSQTSPSGYCSISLLLGTGKTESQQTKMSLGEQGK